MLIKVKLLAVELSAAVYVYCVRFAFQKYFQWTR